MANPDILHSGKVAEESKLLSSKQRVMVRLLLIPVSVWKMRAEVQRGITPPVL